MVFAQPELPLSGIEALNAIESVELWLARNEGSGDDLNVMSNDQNLWMVFGGVT